MGEEDTEVIDLILLGALIIFTLLGFEPIKASRNLMTKGAGESCPKLLKRDASTALKGLSAFFVIAAHIHGWTEGLVPVAAWSKLTDIVLTQLGGMGVLVFFFLSGYGIQEGYGKRSIDRGYIIKRIKNVWLPYVELKLIFIIADLATKRITLSNIPQRLWGIVTLEDWFIFVIVIEYIFYYVARKALEKRYIYLLLGLNIVLMVVFIIQQRADRYLNSMWLFLFGIVFSMYQEHIIRFVYKHYHTAVVMSAVVFLMAGVIFALNKGSLWADMIKPVSGMALCMLFICILLRNRINSPFLKWGGQRSLYLYIVHLWSYSFLLKWITNIMIHLIVFAIVTVVIVEAFFRVKKRIW